MLKFVRIDTSSSSRQMRDGMDTVHVECREKLRDDREEATRDLVLVPRHQAEPDRRRGHAGYPAPAAVELRYGGEPAVRGAGLQGVRPRAQLRARSRRR